MVLHARRYARLLQRQRTPTPPPISLAEEPQPVSIDLDQEIDFMEIADDLAMSDTQPETREFSSPLSVAATKPPLSPDLKFTTINGPRDPNDILHSVRDGRIRSTRSATKQILSNGNPSVVNLRGSSTFATPTSVQNGRSTRASPSDHHIPTLLSSEVSSCESVLSSEVSSCESVLSDSSSTESDSSLSDAWDVKQLVLRIPTMKKHQSVTSYSPQRQVPYITERSKILVPTSLLGQNVTLGSRSKVNVAMTSSSELLLSASRNGEIKQVQLLLKKRDIDVNQCDEYKRTSLHFASVSGYIDVVAALLTHPAINIDLGDVNGNTALHLGMLILISYLIFD
jgi:hypothetical protein